MKRSFLVLTISLFLFVQSFGQAMISDAGYRSVQNLADSVSLNKGNLKLYNLFKLQVRTIYENQDKGTASLRKAVVEKTYLPFKEFWSGYVGSDSIYFDEVILPLLKDSVQLIESKAALFSGGHIDNYFRSLASKMRSFSGFEPKGKWYLAFGSGITDLGGLGDGVMVLDLTHNKTTLAYTKFILPHELTHQIFDRTNKVDTSARGLYRVINEGLAVYVNEKLPEQKNSLEEYLQYTPEELEWCLKNEPTIAKKLKPFLLTGNPEHAVALADRGQKVFKGGPGAIGYFLGYRICAAYVQKNGANSWKELFVMPVREILEKSGYDPQ